jgi:hypothetical protein
VAERLTLNHFLTLDFNEDILLELSEFLNWNIHELALPMRVFTAVVTNAGAPFLLAADTNKDERIHLVERTTEISFEVRTFEVES